MDADWLLELWKLCTVTLQNIFYVLCSSLRKLITTHSQYCYHQWIVFVIIGVSDTEITSIRKSSGLCTCLLVVSRRSTTPQEIQVFIGVICIGQQRLRDALEDFTVASCELILSDLNDGVFG